MLLVPFSKARKLWVFIFFLFLGGFIGAVFFAAFSYEQDNYEEMISYIQTHKDHRNLLAESQKVERHTDYFQYQRAPETYKPGQTDIHLIRFTLKCGTLQFIALSKDGEPLQNQWDFRYLQAKEPGEYVIVTNIPLPVRNVFTRKDMTASGYRILGEHEDQCLSLIEWKHLPIIDYTEWPTRVYVHDIFRVKGSRLYPSRASGFRTDWWTAEKLKKIFSHM